MMKTHERQEMGHSTGYGLARGYTPWGDRIRSVLWTLTMGLGGVLIAVGLTYVFMSNRAL